MKAVEYGKEAASAEVRRLQRVMVRYAIRVGFLVVAALFGLFALFSAHILLWMLCYGPWHTGKVWASVIVLGVDVLFAAVFVFLGRGKRASIVEVEARMERDRNIAAMRSALAFSAVTATVMGPAGRAVGRSAWGLLKGRRNRPARRRGR